MRLTTLYLAGALSVMAIPLSAGAAPSLPGGQTTVSTEQMSRPDACGPGWYWEHAGYAPHGKFRPAHCARRW
jgi:hypothetical protein